MRALLAACFLCTTFQSGWAQTVASEADVLARSARYGEPTDRYPHGILGRIAGWGTLDVVVSACAGCADERVRLRLPENRVFEDIKPRLWDVTGDGKPEVVVVESDQEKGARLVVLTAVVRDGRASIEEIAATDFLGTRFRWLAPVAAADFDGDGRIEIAYVETPHRDKVLRLVRVIDGNLILVASLSGVTAHRIGQEQIEGKLRLCAGVPELVLLSADYTRVIGLIFSRDAFKQLDLGPARIARLPRNAASC